ncbi:MarR family transcriptional regulator [Nodosilinea sp. E11]|uniref:MarR family winged helix-turn-helix transcriptional regulator n=1 Tax=Nodosilinea sp. E11 TaxID=3037479 RepID=UPI0029343942|nr:MarR family transcriptional regulator [Nodosilinea sp. E11]WOD37594.1 MarR family transcriptional regulator [Nodosilinea sp. E11]
MAPIFFNSSSQVAQEPFVGAMRELARAYHAFSTYSDAHMRQFDLTPAQFDVLATLNNTVGMAMGDIGEKTLITKGTLTGVVDRLVQKQLVLRETPADNRRSVIVRLTPAGQSLFEKASAAHLAQLRQRVERLDPADLDQLQTLLGRLRQVF